MKLTIEMLDRLIACDDGKEWFVNSKCKTVAGSCKKAMKEGHHDWANWLVIKLLNRDDRIRLACYAARLVLHIYEDKFPGDMRPRQVIEKAERYVENKHTDAFAESMSAFTATDVWTAARASAAARYAKDAKAAWAAHSATWNIIVEEKIINYGLSLLEGK